MFYYLLIWHFFKTEVLPAIFGESTTILLLDLFRCPPHHLLHLKINIHILNALQYVVTSSLAVLTMPPLINIPVEYAVDAILAVGTIPISRPGV